MKLLINETEPAFMSLSCAEYKRINIDFLIKQSFKAAQDGRQRTWQGGGGCSYEKFQRNFPLRAESKNTGNP